MTTTGTTIDRRRASVSTSLAHTWSAACTVPMTLLVLLTAAPGLLMARYRRCCRDDELFLIVAAAAALKIYWGDVSTFVTSSWDGITGQGGN
jgi:hypothetical protein